MSWSLSAHGETSTEAEAELLQRLSVVLGNRKFGTLATQFSGADHNGPVPAVAVKGTRKAADDGSGSDT